jgi:hypothetical protein
MKLIRETFFNQVFFFLLYSASLSSLMPESRWQAHVKQACVLISLSATNLKIQKKKNKIA